jgi:hypothetical protein
MMLVAAGLIMTEREGAPGATRTDRRLTAAFQPANQRRFSRVTSLVAGPDGHFEAEIDSAWTIRGKPHGGYLLAMLGRAAATVTTHMDVIAASAHFLRAPTPGPAVIDTEVLRAGRSASQIRARMSQDGQACVESLVTTAELERAGSPYWERGLPEIGVASYEESMRLPSSTPSGTRIEIMTQIDLRLEPESTGYMTGKPRGRGELRGWLMLPEGEQFDPISLLFAVDALPPATFDIEVSGWVPTLELTAYVRALPAPGPVRILQRAQLIDGQRVDEACHVWDQTGRLVAQGTQLAGVRLG